MKEKEEKEAIEVAKDMISKIKDFNSVEKIIIFGSIIFFLSAVYHLGMLLFDSIPKVQVALHFTSFCDAIFYSSIFLWMGNVLNTLRNIKEK